MKTYRSHPHPRVLLCISGSIAAYKMADLVSLLRKDSVEVQCILTSSAKQFVSPLVLETLSQNPVKSDLFGDTVSGTEHIDLARWPDLIVFAPASAQTLARLSLGLADDLLGTVALASRKPWLIAPAMNTVMWEAPPTQEHITRLKARGAQILEPASGLLACGEMGAGKLPPVTELYEIILKKLSVHPAPPQEIPLPPSTCLALHHQHLLITNGPTVTQIDAVRYITNPSTGKMGAAMAEAALARGAKVTVIQGMDKGVVLPADPQETGRLKIIPIRTAEEMLTEALRVLPTATGVIAAAAVMDYRVKNPSIEKQKRTTDDISLELTPSVDVLQKLRLAATADQWFLGFAAETHAIETQGRAKLERKNLDWLFANRVAQANEKLETGFGTNQNEGILISKAGDSISLTQRDKIQIAAAILDQIVGSKRFTDLQIALPY